MIKGGIAVIMASGLLEELSAAVKRIMRGWR
jgi:hypothetical protein